MDALTPAEHALCAALLQRIADDPTLIDTDERLKALVARIHKEGRRGARQQKRIATQQADRATKQTAALARREAGVTPQPRPQTGDAPRLNRPTLCYICKQRYHEIDPFYHSLCPTCAQFNAIKRVQRTDLTGRTALVTGARIKIGFELTLKLLRDGATVIATTRFPRDAARRFLAQPDATDWQDRLTLIGLDLRFLPAVEAFAKELTTLDLLFHNAAQTVRRPTTYYVPLLAAENEPLPALAARWIATEGTPRMASSDEARDTLAHWFPAGVLDRDGEPLDARPQNSWRLRLGEVEPVELIETVLINTLAPFLLTNALRPVLARSVFSRRFVVAVSAMEGQFARPGKTYYHPHTNMAKAALNMLTRTSATDLATENIYLNSVDTGWITDENPLPVRKRIFADQGFIPPLDCIDGAARIYDPVVQGLVHPETPPHGHFFKDYQPHAW